jgi:sugar phosphate isomerase/epimerase
MIRLAFSIYAFSGGTIEQAIQTIGRIGYRGIELLADVPHSYPPEMGSDARREAIAIVRQSGLVVSNMNASTLFASGDTYHPTWIENDASLRQERVEHTINAIELGAEFGARTVSLQPGGPMIGTKISRQLAGDRYAEGIAMILPCVKERGMIVGIEPEPGLFIESSAEYLEFKNRYFKNEDAVKMNCDVGHLFCVGEDPAEVICRMPEQICHVDLEDVAKSRVHQHLMPGEGMINFANVFQALKDIQYHGWATVQLYPTEAQAEDVAKQAYQYLKPLLG